MSILTELMHGKITFSQAAAKAAGWAQALTAHDANLTAAAGEAMSIVKQGASDAISIADSALATHAAPIDAAVEAALETALAAATGGASVPFNALIDSGIDRLTQVAVATAHAWALSTKARLATPQAAAPNAPAPQGS